MDSHDNQLNEVLVQLDEARPVPFKRRALRSAWKWGKRVVGWGSLVVIVLTLCMVTWINQRGLNRINDLISQIMTRNLKAKPEVKVDDADNAAVLYEAAMQVIVDLPEKYKYTVPIQGHVDWPKFGEGFSPQQAAHLERIAARNDLVYRITRQARERTDAVYDWGKLDDVGVRSRKLSTARDMLRWMELKAMSLQANGDPDGAFDMMMSVLDFTSTLLNEKSSLCHFYNASTVCYRTDYLEGHLSRCELSQEQLVQLHNQLLELEAEIDLQEMVAQDILRFIDLARHVRRDVLKLEIQYQYTQRHFEETLAELSKSVGGIPISTEESWPTFSWCESSVLRQIGYWCHGLLQSTHANAGIQLLPLYDQLSSDALATNPKPTIAFGDPPQLDVMYYPKCIPRMMSYKSSIRAFAAGLQCELYRMKNGHWPTDWSDMQMAAPLDAMGQPIIMKQNADGILMVYTIGINGRDDDNQWRGGETKDDMKDDSGIKLLPVIKRNSKPTLTEIEDNETKQRMEQLFESLKGAKMGIE